MQMFLVALLFLFSTYTRAADETDYAMTLKAQGYKYCNSAINKAANWLVDQDAGTVAQWKEGDADRHMGVLIATRRYANGNTLLHLSAMRASDGGCDVSFSLVVPVEKSCTGLRETTFRDWKFFGDVQGIPLYDDPTTNSISVALQPIGTMCIVNKMGMLFYGKDELTVSKQ